MTRILTITGTDTGVGKTVVTAAVAAVALKAGLSVAVVKPVQTGVGRSEVGDLDHVRRLSGAQDVHEFARLSEPLAPGTAGRRAGLRLPSVSEMAERVAEMRDRDVVLVEGAGGLLVDLDGAGGTLADLADRLGAAVLVVARAGLGTLNAAALTCEAIRSRGLDCAGVVIGAWPAAPGLAEKCNVEDLPRYTDVPLVGRLPEDAGSLEPRGFLEMATHALDAGALGLTGVLRG